MCGGCNLGLACVQSAAGSSSAEKPLSSPSFTIARAQGECLELSREIDGGVELAWT